MKWQENRGERGPTFVFKDVKVVKDCPRIWFASLIEEIDKTTACPCSQPEARTVFVICVETSEAVQSAKQPKLPRAQPINFLEDRNLLK